MKNENDVSPEEFKQNTEATGTDLKTIRESMGMTLKDIFKLTRIRISMIEAIEKEEYHLLPEPVYTRNFIRTYAKVLDVDSEKILFRYEKYLEQQHKPPRDEKIATKSSWLKSHRKILGWTLSILFVIVFLVFLLYPNKKEVAEMPAGEEAVDKTKTSTEVKESKVQLTGDERTADERVKAEDRVSGSQDIAVTEATCKLTIEATEQTWLRIGVDSNPPYEFLLKPGEKIHNEALTGFTLDIGNAGGISVTFQGKSLGKLGESGQVIHLTLPKSTERRR